MIFTDNINYSITSLGDQIIFTEYLDDAMIDIDKIKEIKELVKNHVKGRTFISVVDMTGITGAMTNEAKTFIAEDVETNEMKELEILLVSNTFVRVLVSTYLQFFKPRTRTVVVYKMVRLIEVLQDCKIETKTIESITKKIRNKRT